MDDKASLLVDDNDVIVLKHDRYHNRWVWFGKFFAWNLGRIDGYRLPFGQPQFATGFDYSIDKHSSTLNKFGRNRPRHVKDESDDSVNTLTIERTWNYLNQHRSLLRFSERVGHLRALTTRAVLHQR